MTPNLLHDAAVSIMANIAATFVACGVTAPGVVYVGRQGSTADDECPCDGTLVGIFQSFRPHAQPRIDLSRCPAARVEASLRIRYSACWAATIQGNPPRLPTPTERRAAAQGQLTAAQVLVQAYYSPSTYRDMPAALDCEDLTVAAMDPYVAGGCAGWQTLVTFTFDAGA